VYSAGVTPPSLRFRHVSKSFPIGLGLTRREVLSGVDLELAAGQTLGLVGPNGSGKSTIQRLAAGIERPSSGEIRAFGGYLSQSEVRERIGFLPEDSPFPGELTARSALDLLGSLHGMKRRQVRARGAELLERVGLTAQTRTRLGKFSRGMLRRFGLAQAWLHSPDLILLDEPTAGLDAPGFEVLEGLLEDARKRGAAVLFSSHLPSDLSDHCDELALLLGGKVVARGTPGELLSRPGCWKVELEGMEEEEIEALRSWVEENGGEVRKSAPAGRTLFELYKEMSEG
jgi:ABC-2 type transport system ATP-binding protein